MQQLVCYVHSTGCVFLGGEGGGKGLGENDENEQKNNKIGKNFQSGIDLSPRSTRAGGPNVAPPGRGSSARDTPTQSSSSGTVGKNGRAPSPWEGKNIEDFVAIYSRFCIPKIFAKDNQKIKIFFTCTGCGSESNFYNFSKILILLFTLMYKHGFK